MAVGFAPSNLRPVVNLLHMQFSVAAATCYCLHPARCVYSWDRLL